VERRCNRVWARYESIRSFIGRCIPSAGRDGGARAAGRTRLGRTGRAGWDATDGDRYGYRRAADGHAGAQPDRRRNRHALSIASGGVDGYAFRDSHAGRSESYVVDDGDGFVDQHGDADADAHRDDSRYEYRDGYANRHAHNDGNADRDDD
jgi:hypothetical protein